MGRTVKTIKSSSRKALKEADIPEYSDEPSNEHEEFNEVTEALTDEDDAPEAVSMSTSKAEIISQIKSEREARRLDRESKRQKTVSLQEQNRQARLRKAKEAESKADEISEEEKVKEPAVTSEICPLPENIFEAAILQKQQQQQQQQQKQNQIRFESENDSEPELDSADILKTVREQRAKATKRRLVDSLPFAVVEVGSNGKSRISKAEIKARRAISKLKMEKAGSQVRRIDSVLDRARKNRSAPNVFYRQNTFY